MTYVIVGASAGLGRALASRLAALKANLVLISSDLRDLEAMASDLVVRHSISVATVQANLTRENSFLDRIAESAEKLGPLEGLLLPVGAVVPGDDETLGNQGALEILQINFSAVVSITKRLYPLLKARGRGSIVGFGSIASIRGRKSNMHYAAAKRALQSFFESLRHAAVGSGVIVQFYMIGYLDTSLAFGIPTPLPKASPEVLSTRVVAHLRKDLGVVHYPRYWRLISMMVRMTPWFIFKRMKF